MVNWTEEQLKEKMKEYVTKADDTSNSYFDRDVYRQLYYYYKSLLMDKSNENNRSNHSGDSGSDTTKRVSQ
jgi:hypothetical protein